MKCNDCKRKEQICEICGRPIYPYNGIGQYPQHPDPNVVYCGDAKNMGTGTNNVKRTDE